MKYFYVLIILSTIFFINASAASIILHAKNATVWLPQQTISGSLKDFSTTQVIIHLNDSNFTVDAQKDQFSFSVMLTGGRNIIWAEAKNSNETVNSDTLEFVLGFKPLPVVKPFATNKENIITLHIQPIYNPYNRKLSYYWQSDMRNPAPVKINHQHDSLATLNLPYKKGIYYFNLFIKDGDDSVQYQTLVTRTNSIHCFSLDTDHAAWIDSAVIYEVTPHVFVKDGMYSDITKKLPELKRLGINTIWLQPVFKTQRGGQGYDVTDYFSLRPDLGDEKELQQLISTAKQLNIKVLFDFVPNHTSIFHPYAEDCIKYGKESHYYDFYQHTNDGAKYSSLYRIDSFGFVHYFWKNLVNLNYGNKEVQRWIIEACKYWINKFSIDGYRFDAVWAVNARDSTFGKQLQLELKSIKPDIFLLAEDKGADPEVYQKGFDAAFDWEMDTAWISHWSWQYDYDPKNNLTIFNHPDVSKRGDLLRKALFHNGDTLHLRLRFIENNDVSRFIESHDIERTKMVAALEFALPGIALIYNGQEIGSHVHPYSSKPIFLRDTTIQSLDKDSLFKYYQNLIHLRKQYKSLRSLFIDDLKVSPSNSVVTFHRWVNNEHFVVTINMADSSQITKVSFENSRITLKKNTKYVLTDMLTKESFPVGADTVSIKMNRYSTRILLLHSSSSYK